MNRPEDIPERVWEEARHLCDPNWLDCEYIARAILAAEKRVREECADDQWRDLALQFDGHRMEALAMLRYVSEAKNSFEGMGRIGEIKAFLSKPPLSGEAVLVERLAAIRKGGEHA